MHQVFNKMLFAWVCQHVNAPYTQNQDRGASCWQRRTRTRINVAYVLSMVVGRRLISVRVIRQPNSRGGCVHVPRLCMSCPLWAPSYAADPCDGAAPCAATTRAACLARNRFTARQDDHDIQDGKVPRSGSLRGLCRGVCRCLEGLPAIAPVRWSTSARLHHPRTPLVRPALHCICACSHPRRVLPLIRCGTTARGSTTDQAPSPSRVAELRHRACAAHCRCMT